MTGDEFPDEIASFKAVCEDCGEVFEAVWSETLLEKVVEHYEQEHPEQVEGAKQLAERLRSKSRW